MATVVRSMRIDEEVLEAFDRFCESKKERSTAVVQRLMIEAMKRVGQWPPKPKEGK